MFPLNRDLLGGLLDVSLQGERHSMATGDGVCHGRFGILQHVLQHVLILATRPYWVDAGFPRFAPRVLLELRISNVDPNNSVYVRRPLGLGPMGHLSYGLAVQSYCYCTYLSCTHLFAVCIADFY